MIDRDMELQMDMVQEMTWEEFVEFHAYLTAWHACESRGIYFDPYPMEIERDCNGGELNQWMWN
jgi:hypothetical protein